MKKQKSASKENNKSNNTTELKSLKGKIKNNNLIIAKADKGNTVVVMEKQDYINKTEDFIKASNITKLQKDPTTKFNTQLKQALKDTQHLLSDEEKVRMCNKNPSAPTMKALPKLHKENVPIRPVINCRNAPTYQTAKWLHKHITEHYVFNNNKSVKNTQTLFQNLSQTQVKENSRLVSFDIQNMYTNIPTIETIKIIEENLKENSKLGPNAINETLILLRLVLKQNYFIFNKTVYLQEHGLGMGSPLSGLLADIFINNLENKLFEDNQISSKIQFWNRYVDDTLVIYNDDLTDTNELLDTINELHPNITFTAEKEDNESINFLDVTITREHNRLKYNIFRKATHTSHTINNYSNHPTSHKKAAFQSMINRALNYPLEEAGRKEEISTIKSIAVENNFNTKLIDNMITKTKQKRTRLAINPRKEKDVTQKYAAFTYINQNIYKITNILKKHEIKIAFRTNNKLGHHILNNTIDKQDPLKQSGVYKLTCQTPNCNSTYIGMSARNFDIRYQEHRRAFSKTGHSAFAEHMKLTGHSFTSIQQDLSILHKQKGGKALMALEQIEIQVDLEKSILENSINLNEYGIRPKSILHSLIMPK